MRATIDIEDNTIMVTKWDKDEFAISTIELICNDSSLSDMVIQNRIMGVINYIEENGHEYGKNVQDSVSA